MRQHEETRILPYPADKMFDLVADIESYPDFIPWCANVRVISRSPHPAGTEIRSEMMVSFKALRESFLSQAVLASDKSSIEIRYLERVFRFFRSQWRFHSREDGSTLIEFETSYEFRTKLLEALAGAFFWRASQKIVAAFEERAHRLYGGSG